MRTLSIATLLTLALVVPGALFAQVGPASPWEINVHAGTLVPDEDLLGDDSAEFMVGARIARRLAHGFAIGANLDWSPVSDVDFPELTQTGFMTDVNVVLYSVDLTYTLPLRGPLDVFASVGAGAGTISYDDQPPTLDDDSSTSFLLPFGGGIRWTSPSGRWAIRGDVRDQVLFLEPEDGPFLLGTGDTEDLHNVEATVGVSFLF